MAVKEKKAALVAGELFGEGVEIDMGRIFPVLLMATMSSGKSTLINALLGRQMLPSKSSACTAKPCFILNDGQSGAPLVYLTDTDGNTVRKEENIAEVLSGANEDANVAGVFMKGQVRGVLNTDKALLIIDTPGSNNARELSRGAIAENILENILEKVGGGLVLYVLDATQLGINDDRELLRKLKTYLKNNGNTRVLFVINKVDQIDIERESMEQLVTAARDYLADNGFPSPEIIPVSALAAGLFNKAVNGEALTRNEYRAFLQFYDLFRPRDFTMNAYAITEDWGNPFSEVTVRDVTYPLSDLRRAVENTGIKLLEKKIQRMQILSGVRY